MAETIVFPPNVSNDCPATYQAKVQELDKEVRDTLANNKVPWHMHHQLADDGLTTLPELSNRFKDDDDLYHNGPKEFKVEAGTGSYIPAL